MYKKTLPKLSLFLIATVIAGCFGFVQGNGYCYASERQISVPQCSAEFISSFLSIGHTNDQAALSSKLFGFVRSVLVAGAVSLIVLILKDPEVIRIRSRKFSTHLPRSWPLLFTDYPVHLVSSSQP